MNPYLIPMVACLNLLASSLAHANAETQQKRCVAKADALYDRCMADPSGVGTSRCDGYYKKRLASCTEAYETQFDAESNGAKYDNNGQYIEQQIGIPKSSVSQGQR